MGQEWKETDIQGWLGFWEPGLIAKHFVEHSGLAKKQPQCRS